MNFFTMMQKVEKTHLEMEAEQTFKKLVLCVESCADAIVPNSRVAKETLQNWRLGAEEQRKWYERRGINKSSSTIRSQINYLSGLLVACFMPCDIMYQVFFSNDRPRLMDIENRIYVISNSDFCLSDLAVDLSILLKDVEMDADLGNNEMVDKVLAFIKKLDKKHTLELFDSCDKPTLISTLQALTSPLILTKQYKYLDKDGIERVSTQTEFNSEKMELLIRMRDLEEPKATEVKEKVVEKYIYKQEQLPYKNFMSMSMICDLIMQYCNNYSQTDIYTSGTTLKEAQKFVMLFTDRKYFEAVLHKINRIDLDATLDQYKI